jgi:hypothetical protein
MRKQRLPKDFWTDIKPYNTNTYCFWYGDNNQLKKCRVRSQKEARDFVKRAEERNVAAFATTYVEQESENQVFVCSFKNILSKYNAVDGVRLEIASADYKLIHHPEEKAKHEASTRSIEQWSEKGYGTKYADAEYFVSWYNTSIHKFEGEKYTTRKEAEDSFNEKQNADIPVRLVEKLKDSKRIHEIKAACQHWCIGMGNYLEQLADETLPIGEIPYIFSNMYLTSEMKVEDNFGYLDFHVEFKDYSIQIRPACCTGSANSASIMVYSLHPYCMTYYVVIDNNPIIAPWLARIERQW